MDEIEAKRDAERKEHQSKLDAERREYLSKLDEMETRRDAERKEYQSKLDAERNEAQDRIDLIQHEAQLQEKNSLEAVNNLILGLGVPRRASSDSHTRGIDHRPLRVFRTKLGETFFGIEIGALLSRGQSSGS